MDVVAWCCNKCKLNYSLPTIPMPMCYLCNQPLVRVRTAPLPPPPLPPKHRGSAPPLPPKEPLAPPLPPRSRGGGPPLPPRNRGGSPPPVPPHRRGDSPPPVPSHSRGASPQLPPRNNPGRERLDVVALAGTPMDHYFNLYLTSVLQGGATAPGSKHPAYRIKLQRHNGFVTNAQKDGHTDIKSYIGYYEQSYRALKTSLARERVVVKHLYNQVLDYRLYAHHFTTNGWCLGISGFWLKHKRSGVNVFPSVIYNSDELETEKGAPIKLMSNQEKLNKHAGLVQVGGQNAIPIQAKNVLDYIAGGRHSGGLPAIHLSMSNHPERIVSESKRFYSMLAPRAASPEQKAADRFAVLHFMESGGGHMMALDMEAVEFFDPNFGVFTVANQSRQKLVDFVFQKFYPICYPGERVKDFYLIRIE